MFPILIICSLFLKSNASPPELRLMNDLMVGYVKEERPVLDSAKPVIVTLGISLQQIINLNEKEEQLEVSAWLKFAWRDENLRWEPLVYENVTDLRHPAGTLWQPDILLYNSVDPAFDSTYKANLINYADGTVNWLPPGIFKVSCKLDIYWFPFDEQICYFKFGSWSFSRDKIELKVGDFDFSEFLPNGEWLILSSKANVSVKYYECCPEAYEDIKFTLHLRRRTLYYAFNLIMPCFLVMILVILGFTLCPETCEKIGLQISVTLAICIFLTLMNEITPHTSEAVPLLGVFFESCMVISVLATSFTVYVQSYHFRNHQNTRRMGFWAWPGFFGQARPGQLNSSAVIYSPKFRKQPKMRFILLEWAPWFLRMELPKRENNISTIKQSWQDRKARDEDARTAFDYTSGTGKLVQSIGDSMKENYDFLIFQVKARQQPGDNKTVERLKVLQRIYEHIKLIREHDDDTVEDKNVSFEWRFAAIVVDRLGLISFTLLLTVTSLTIGVRAPYLSA